MLVLRVLHKSTNERLGGHVQHNFTISEVHDFKLSLTIKALIWSINYNCLKDLKSKLESGSKTMVKLVFTKVTRFIESALCRLSSDKRTQLHHYGTWKYVQNISFSAQILMFIEKSCQISIILVIEQFYFHQKWPKTSFAFCKKQLLWLCESKKIKTWKTGCRKMVKNSTSQFYAWITCWHETIVCSIFASRMTRKWTHDY